MIHKTIREIIDHTTGEILEEEKISVKRVNSDDFVMVFLEDLSGLFKIETSTELRLLALLWKKADYKDDFNAIAVLKAYKVEWAKEIGVSLQTINNTLSSLVKKELLIKKERSLYILNPNFFFKGALSKRPVICRAIIEYRLNQNDLDSNGHYGQDA